MNTNGKREAADVSTLSDSTRDLPKPTKKLRAATGRVMYIESKGGGLTGPSRIGRVSFSKTGKTIYYQGKTFQSLKGAGFKSNYFKLGSGEEYWISGPKRNGQDALYGKGSAEIDEDVREEYWKNIRRQPQRSRERVS